MPRSAPAIDPDGWLTGVNRCPSPNSDARPEGESISLVVIHNISLPPGQFGTGCVRQLFSNALDAAAHPYFEQIRDLRVSAHFLIERDGRATQFVSCLARAWHAGASSHQGRTACNDFSVGIELEGTDDQPFEAAQYEALNRLLEALAESYPIAAVVGHSDVAPGRKTDPGPCFDWSRLTPLRARF